jgi:hypothetical protein
MILSLEVSNFTYLYIWSPDGSSYKVLRKKTSDDPQVQGKRNPRILLAIYRKKSLMDTPSALSLYMSTGLEAIELTGRCIV